MSEIKMGPWPLGIDHVSDETRMPTDNRGRIIAARDAVNGDFSSSGLFGRRRGPTSLLGTATHSLFSCAAGTFGMTGRVLNRITVTSTAATLSPLLTLTSADPVSYDILNGQVVFSNPGTIGLITSAGAVPLGVDEPGSFAAAPDAAGGLYAGRYGVVVTHVASGGEESAASSLATVDVVAGGGIRLTGLAHTLPLRVYRTGANGDVLYRCADIPVGMSQYLIGAGQTGRACDTRNLARTPPGRIVRYWQGRLLIVRGSTIYFTEAMRYGLVDPRTNFIQLPSRITMVRTVDAGIFVGTADGVRFYRGTDPKELREEWTGALPAVPGTDTEIDSSILTADSANGTKLAAWLSLNGFVIGMASGQVVEPQAKRIRLVAEAGGIAVNDRRLIAIVN